MVLTPDDIFRANANLAMRQKSLRVRKSPRKKSASPENAIVKACLKYLQMLGCFVWRNNTGAYKPYSDSERVVRYGKVGSGDIIGLTPSGKFLACECKYGSNSQSDFQKGFQDRVERNNGIYILAYSVEDVERRKAEICR